MRKKVPSNVISLLELVWTCILPQISHRTKTSHLGRGEIRSTGAMERRGESVTDWNWIQKGKCREEWKMLNEDINQPKQ